MIQNLSKALVTVVFAILACFWGCDSPTAPAGPLTSGQAASAEAPAPAPEQAHKKLVTFLEDDRFGYEDETGKVVLKPLYWNARDFSEGLAAVNVGALRDHHGFLFGGKWGYIDTRGEVVVPVTLDYAGPFSEGLALVSDEDGRRFIDTSGKTVIKIEDVSHVGRFSEGLAPTHVDRSLEKKGWRTRYIDKQGQVVLTVEGFGEEFSEGLAQITVRGAEGRKEGFIDRNGKMVIEPKYAEVDDFSEGLAAVRPKKTEGYYGKGDLWGYIDKMGTMVIEPQFNEVRPFKDGTARVHIGGKLVETTIGGFWDGGEWQLVDRKGKALKTPEGLGQGEDQR